MGPLAGIKILDFTWALAGPFGTMILADMGAEVWKVEPVGIVEDDRGPGPIVNGAKVYHFSINRGKDSIALDLKTDAGREIALSLAERADVVTENFAPGTMARLGLGYDDVRARNPRIVYASTSGFGQTGPYRERGAVDVIVQAMSGLMSITGHPDGPPARAGYSIADMAGGMFTAIGVLGALVERGRSGEGQYVDVAMLDAQMTLLEGAITRYFATGQEPGRLGTRHPLITPFQAFPAADGWIVIAGVKDWALFCALLEADELVTDARFQTNELRTKHHAELEPLLVRALSKRTAREWLALLEPACLVAPMNTIPQVVREPHLAEREMFADVPTPDGRTMRIVTSPLKYSRTPVRVERGADSIGGHTAAILRDVLGYDAARIAALERDGVIATGPGEEREGRTRPSI